MIDRGSVQAKIADFDKRHGGNPVLHFEQWFYADGAYRDWEPMGILAEPPENDFERLSNIVTYHSARLRHAVATFDQFKEGCMMFGQPNREAVGELKRLQGIVQEMSSGLERAKSALAETPTARMRAAARQAEAERMAEVEQFRNEVRQVTI